MAEYTNSAIAAVGNATQTATVTFEADQVLPITLVKNVNKPGEIYFEGESIVLTIDLARTTPKNISNITLTDTIPTIITFNPDTGVIINGSHGSVDFDSNTRVLTISNLSLNDNNPISTVTISGTIHFT